MIQEAIVSKLLSDSMAEVSVVRATACGKNCSSCEGCMFQSELKVVAYNSISAAIGQKVLIESKSSMIFGAAILVYLLPMIMMLAGCIVAFSLGASENICVALGFAGLFVGLAVSVLLHRITKKKKPITYSIIKELN